MAITITTWNVQNLSQNSNEFDEKLDFLVNTLQTLNSDVIALQEILDLDALNALATRLGFQSFAATPDGRGNRVAFLTRNNPVSAPTLIDQWQLPNGEEIHRFNSDGEVIAEPSLPRPAFQITLSDNGEEIDIINIHMKSKLLTFGGNFSTSDERLRVQTAFFALERRAGESTTLRERATALLSSGRRTVVLGDFNDGAQAATTEILYGPSGSQPRGPEDATNARGAFQRGDDGDPQRLFNVTNLVPLENRWTRRHQGQPELLDHILASVGMMPRINGLRQVPTMSILNEEVPNLPGGSPNTSNVIPDHAPVTAAFV
ncbi:endonuclease/exonuclease/phosphatase family protein [Acaryochloris sp. IP29b_bin.137]|uniref:endonuclease/exonuclease/phosphatase family protein n=1 Tax=Acaryochloris sp. IP29b_bin.137 TaxID=2969217 RepID=UPI00261626BB|nr:endonuclease/exonuclease/phosphatase family protein [Acaryochloris sp. IP29b_bin.137]